MPSRLSRLEEKRTKKQLFTVSIGIIVLIVALMTIGIPLLIRISVFLGNFKSANPTNEDDITPPVAPVLAPILEATNSAVLKIEGYGEPAANLKLYHNGLQADEVVLGKDGNFEFEVKLQNGDNTFYAVAIDAAGNESQRSAEQTIVYKKNGPQLEVTEPVDGQEFGENFATIQIKGKTDIGAQIRINDRFVNVADDGTFTFDLQLAAGENHITVRAFDFAGNQTEKQLKVIYRTD